MSSGSTARSRSPSAIRRLGAAGLMRWQIDSCKVGIDGWFHWHWRGTGDHEVWTGSEGNSAINTVLSPGERPDPCKAASFPFLRENLALGAKTRASRSLAGEGPARAVDGKRETSWVSGDGPASGSRSTSGRRRPSRTCDLFVNQSPAGRTIHRITGGRTRDNLRALHTFDGSTTYGDDLSWTPSEPLTGIRFIRIETTRSPSWVAWQEIEVLGQRP